MARFQNYNLKSIRNHTIKIPGTISRVQIPKSCITLQEKSDGIFRFSYFHQPLDYKNGFSIGLFRRISSKDIDDASLRHNFSYMEMPLCPIVSLAITYPGIKTPLACYLPDIVQMACHPCAHATIICTQVQPGSPAWLSRLSYYY